MKIQGDKMQIEKLEIDYKKELKQIKESYQKDFPIYERMPFYYIKKLLKEQKLEIFLFKEQEKICGYMITIKSKTGYILIEYFAILEKYRSKGYGSICLKLFREYYSESKGFIIEAEKRGLGKDEKENQVREKRIAFYQKNGYRQTKVIVNLYGTTYEIWVDSLKEKIPTDEVVESQIEIYQGLLGENTAKKRFKFEIEK